MANKSIQHNRQPQRRYTPEQIHRNRVRVGTAVGGVLLVAGAALTPTVVRAIDGPTEQARVTFGAGASEWDAAKAILQLEGDKEPSKDALNDETNDVIDAVNAQYPNSVQMPDVVYGEVPDVSQGQTVSVSVPVRHYPYEATMTENGATIHVSFPPKQQ